MSTQVVQQYYEAFNKKDIDAILALCVENVQNDPNQGDPQVGKDKLKAFLETAWAHFDEQVSELVIMANADQSKIATEYLVKGTYYNSKPNLFPATNQYYEIYPTTVFTIKNGKITRMTRHYNTKQWLDIVNPNRS